MPDIPLRAFRNKQNAQGGYELLTGENLSPSTIDKPNENNTGMNRSVSRVAAVANANAERSRANRARRAKRPQRLYVDDDPEEAIGLLESSREREEEVEEGMMLPDSSKLPLSRLKKPPTSKSPKGTLYTSRTIPFHPLPSLQSKYPPNIIRNQKYSIITFFPKVFYEQFKFFFNLYFLLVALSQFVPALKIGFIATYIAPLAFVLCITIGKEAYDDYKRNLRDREANGQKYIVVDPPSISPHLSTRALPSSSLLVGQLVRLQKNDRVPADMVLLWTSDPSGTCFVRTDQLDGETDWKMRLSVGETQGLGEEGVAKLGSGEAEIYADAPTKDIHTFIGTLTLAPSHVSPLTAENVLWANTVLASSATIIGFVIYTGPETRAVMNTSTAGTKVGLLEVEVNGLAKILCTTTFLLSLILVALNGFRGGVFTTHTVVSVFRFLILFSSIIPISLRVNLDLGKSLYSHQIMSDSTIPGTIVRTSTLPEELGRVEYLLSDKTGTLTRNEMEMRRLHMGTMSYGQDSMDEVARQLALAFASANNGNDDDHNNTHTHTRGSSSVALGHHHANTIGGGAGRGRRDMSSRVRDVVQSLALCHNVTPVTNDDGSVTYQASSPDEVAIVTWTQTIGLALVFRDRTKIVLRTDDPARTLLTFTILAIFPFTSTSKRMGIVLLDHSTSDILFLLKGADTVMAPLVQRNDWLEEETGNMGREGLRTLVVARKKVGKEVWAAFESEYAVASTSVGGTGGGSGDTTIDGAVSRAEAQAQVIAKYLEKDMELLGLTGVEDRLQDEVRSTLELMRNAGVKVWMLTGDKVETARCIAISTKMVSRGQYIHEVSKVTSPTTLKSHLDFLQNKLDSCLVIDGESLQLCLSLYKNEFIEIATKLSAVVACRCSPTQKADIAKLIRAYTGKRVCCIGDGGNDVSMIQAADVGIGLVGKEGRQASLAADFSLTQFSHLTPLLLWHGRLSYLRSSTLAQFVIHRGLIISIIQAVFSAIFYFAPIALYQGWLMVGYATVYTMMPVFSLVLDRDVSRETALVYPELYKELVKGRVLGYKSFFEWVMISVYQGAAIMIMSLLLFENEFLHIVSISFTALVLNELIMVALEITTWHIYMIISEIVTLFFYIISIAFLPEYFDLSFVITLGFAWKVAVIVAISALPLWIVKVVKSRVAPAASSKLI